jgi:hypothetical protein
VSGGAGKWSELLKVSKMCSGIDFIFKEENSVVYLSVVFLQNAAKCFAIAKRRKQMTSI